MFFGIVIPKIGINFGDYDYFSLSLHPKERRILWRTSQQQEIDYLEECDGQFSLFEMKWTPKRANTRFPVSFLSAYQVKDKCIVTPENWIDWVIE